MYKSKKKFSFPEFLWLSLSVSWYNSLSIALTCEKCPWNMDKLATHQSQSAKSEIRFGGLIYLGCCLLIRTCYLILYTRMSVRFRPYVTLRVTPPPWILKRCGLESFGQRLINSNNQNKRIFFLFFIFGGGAKINNKKKSI